MAQETKEDKQLIRRKKFIEVSIPITRSKIELIANFPKELKDRTIKLDMTRQLKGKSVELVLKIAIENEKLVAIPKKIILMPYFIRRMIRKRISYVEDSFLTPSQESMLKIKPFLITKRRVSKAVRKTLRNKTKNWIEDYMAERKDNEIFSEILSNRMQKSLSLTLKKTYPLSLCEIRILEITRELKPEEVPKIKPKEKKESGIEFSESQDSEHPSKEPEEYIDQMKEIEDEKIKQAEKEIKETQEKAAKRQSSDSAESEPAIKSSDSAESDLAKEKTAEKAKDKPVKEKKPRKKKEDKKE